MSRFGKPLLATIAIITGLTGAIAVSPPSQAAPAPRSASAAAVALAGSAAPKPPSGAARLGPVSAGTMIHVDVSLKVRDQAALTAFLNGLANRNSPFFHHFLRPGQFGPMFGPTLAQVAAVENALRSAGLSPGRTVTGVSPKAGPAGHTTTVTVHGTGFLPIAGADMALIGSTRIAANCTTTTSCTVKVPAKPAGTTINIRIIAEDFAPSAVTAADRFQYVAAPTLSSLSPKKGTHKGGTKVTIHGTHFIGVRSVHFGTKLATHVTVVSATEITVTAPAGTKGKTVHVTVSAAGGTTSSTSAAGKYTYT